MDTGLDTVFFFGVYPYLAIAVMIVGSIIRYDREPYTWRSGSSQLLRRRQLMVGSILFHLGVLVILGGHLGGLLVPLEVFDWLGIGHGVKQVLAMVAGGVAGVFAILGATLLAHRRFFDARIRATSNFADNAIIVILWVQLALGLATIPLSAGHLDGSEMVKFMSWARGLYTFDLMASSYVENVHPIFKIHLGLGLTIFLLFPFTRLVHIFSAPVRYLWRPGYQIVRTKRLAAGE